MNDSELDKLLRSARVPERDDAFWANFPRRVMTKTQWREQQAGASEMSPRQSAQWKLAAALTAAAAVCVLLVWHLGSWGVASRGQAEADQVAEMEACFRELQPLFPNQLQSVVFDSQGAHLALAEQPDMLPPSRPIFIKICGPRGCLRAVTFSGQKVQFNGDTCEVLLNRQGHVLLVGQHWVWSSSGEVGEPGPYRIAARPLGSQTRT